MNIRQAEIFKAVMSEGSVTAAADKLFVTQPSVSKHLKLLEHSLGLELFIRKGNRLTPTAEGYALYDQLQRLYVGLEKVQRFASDLKHNRSGEISVASPPLLTHQWLPRIIADYLIDKPGVSISLPARGSEWVIESVAARRVDFGLGIFTREIPGIESVTLLELPFVCVLPSGHPLAGEQQIGPEDLNNQSIITLNNFSRWRMQTDAILDEHSVHPSRRIDAFMTSTACQLAAEGAGIAIVDQLTASHYASRNVVIRPFIPFHQFRICLFRSTRWEIASIAADFADKLLEDAADLTRSLKQSYPS